MSSIERQITVTRGPFFFEEDGELMFQFACDNSTIIGPYPAAPKHVAEHADAYQTFLDAKAAGHNPEPEFVARERRETAPSKGLSVLDMIEGRSDATPGETVQVGAGNRKAAPEGDEKAAILAELDALGQPKPHHFTGIEKLRELLALARES